MAALRLLDPVGQKAKQDVRPTKCRAVEAHNARAQQHNPHRWPIDLIWRWRGRRRRRAAVQRLDLDPGPPWPGHPLSSPARHLDNLPDPTSACEALSLRCPQDHEQSNTSWPNGRSLPKAHTAVTNPEPSSLHGYRIHWTFFCSAHALRSGRKRRPVASWSWEPALLAAWSTARLVVLPRRRPHGVVRSGSGCGLSRRPRGAGQGKPPVRLAPVPINTVRVDRTPPLSLSGHALGPIPLAFVSRQPAAGEGPARAFRQH